VRVTISRALLGLSWGRGKWSLSLLCICRRLRRHTVRADIVAYMNVAYAEIRHTNRGVRAVSNLVLPCSPKARRPFGNCSAAVNTRNPT